MFKVLFVFVVCCYSSCVGASTIDNEESILEIKDRSLFVPSRLGNLYLQHYNKDFFVISSKQVLPVHRYNVDKALRDLTNEGLTLFLSVGNLIVGESHSCTERDEVEYTIRGHIRGLGGIGLIGVLTMKKKLEEAAQSSSGTHRRGHEETKCEHDAIISAGPVDKTREIALNLVKMTTLSNLQIATATGLTESDVALLRSY